MNYVLHIASWYPHKYGPRESVFIKEQIEQIASFQKSIVSTVIETDKVLEPRLEVIENDRLKEYLQYVPHRKVFRHIYYFFHFWKLIKSIIREHGKPKFIHVHVMYKAVILAMFAKLRWKVNFIITEHFTIFSKETLDRKKRFIIWYCKWFSKRHSSILAISPYLAQQLINVGFRRVKTIMNFYDEELFYLKKQIPSKAKNFIHISSLKEGHKRPKEIINQFLRAKLKHPRISLTIVGSNIARLDQLKEYCRNKEGITFYQNLSKHEIAILLREHDVFILFSRYETFSLVTLESLVSGLFVLSPDIGGPSTLIKQFGNGRLLKHASEEELYNEIVRCCEELPSYDTNKVEEASLFYSSYAFRKEMEKCYSI